MTNDEIMQTAGTALLVGSAISIVVSWCNICMGRLKVISPGVRLHIIAGLAVLPCIAFVVSCATMPAK